MHPSLLKLLVAAMTCMALVACHANEPWVEVKGKRFYVEIADTDELRARGLMFRDEMADNRGMLFIFRQEAPRSFWMRNTRIPLDIIYLDRDLRVVSIVHNARPCRSQRCPSYPSDGPAMYVLEVNAGQARALGLQRGDALVVGNLELP
jgi:uncharacterized protein